MKNRKWVDRFYTKMQERALAGEGEPPKAFDKFLPGLWTNILTVLVVLILALAALYDAISAIMFGRASLFAWPYLQLVLSISICTLLLMNLCTLLTVLRLKDPIVVISEEGVLLRQWSSRVIGWYEIRSVDRFIWRNAFLGSTMVLCFWLHSGARKWSREEVAKKPFSFLLGKFSHKFPVPFEICAVQKYGGVTASVIHYRKHYAPDADDLIPGSWWRKYLRPS